MIDALPLLLGPEGYQISRSVRLRSSASAYFNRTIGTPTLATRLTYSGWVKRGALGINAVFCSLGQSTGIANYFQCYFNTSNQIQVYGVASTVAVMDVSTAAVFRDPSAYYHVVVVIDTTQSTGTDRVQIYVNSVRQTVTTGATITQNANIPGNTNSYIGGVGAVIYNATYVNFFDGYLTEINFIDGQALTPSSFGENDSITGVWKPKKYTGTYGTNGFYLNFSDPSAATAAAIGKDYSGNGNNWTPNNISVTAGATYDSMLDVPTPWPDGGNGRGNYAVLNPLKNTASISNGNLQTVNAASAGYYTSYATASMDSGKYYWEIVATDDGANARYSGFGIADPSIALTSIGTGIANTQAVNSRGWLQAIRSSISAYTTGLYNNGAAVNTTTRATTSGTRIFMVAYDADTGKCWMGYEGTWWTGDPAAGTSQYFTATAPMMPVFNPYNDGSNAVLIGSANFGQRPFAYTPPTGFKALNTQNLPTPTIAKGGSFFNTVLYTGNATTTGTTQAITGVGFQPDFVWIKSRSSGTYWNMLNDAVRGANQLLYSNAADSEGTLTNVFQSFNADGFTVSNNTAFSVARPNVNAETYVAWNWNAGGSNATNTSGSITSTVRANPTAGFSVVTYTGTGANATVGHGLGVTPRMIIVKARSLSTSWPVYHASLTAAGRVFLDGTNAYAADSAWNSTAPTSSVFSIGPTGFSTNNSGVTYVAYCFAAVAGYSAFGSYTGNGSTDGTMVFTGFQPRWVMVKRTDTTGNWTIHDAARNGYNASGAGQPVLYPNLSNAEQDFSPALDILSNGFKLRTSSADLNASGGTYVYACFASNPFKNSLAR